MDKADLTVLLEAHGGRAQPVASLHVLRAPQLSPDEHAFLAEHQDELATVDLSRWLGVASPEQRPDVLDALARLAEREPGRFEMEIARAPHFELDPAERLRLEERLLGRVPESLIAALSGAAPPTGAPAVPDGEMFDPGDLLDGVDFGPSSAQSPAKARTSARPPAGAETASLGDDLGDLLGDPELFDTGEPAGKGEAPAEDGGLFNDALPPVLGTVIAAHRSMHTARGKAAWRAWARKVALDPREDWSRAVARIPLEMKDAVVRRAASSPRAEERASLLEWLLQNKARRGEIVELSLALITLDPKVESVSQWLAGSFLPRVLADKASWQKFGADVLSALCGRKAFGEMDQLLTSAMTGAGALGPGLVSLPQTGALKGPVFSAFSTMLMDGVGAALTAKDAKSAQAYSAALSSLGYPSRSASKVEALRKKRAARGDVSRLLRVAPARGPKDAPGLEGLIAAVHVLSDAL